MEFPTMPVEFSLGIFTLPAKSTIKSDNCSPKLQRGRIPAITLRRSSQYPVIGVK